MTHTKEKLHRVQKELIKQLTTTENLSFSNFVIDFVSSEQLSYHLRELISKGYIEKNNEKYKLTYLGKDYCNLTDNEIDQLERQPKTGVLLTVVRVIEGEYEELVCKRLRQPYFGKVGRLTGKVQFGESILDTAKRELFEETGLIAEKLELQSINRKIRKSNQGGFVQDVIFYCVLITQFSGTIITNIGIQENFWISKKMIEEKGNKLDFYDDYNFYSYDKPEQTSSISFSENSAQEQGF